MNVNEKVAPTRDAGSSTCNLIDWVSNCGSPPSSSTLMCANCPSLNETTFHSLTLPMRLEVSTTKSGASPSNVSKEMINRKLKSPLDSFSTLKVDMLRIDKSRAFFNVTSSASHEIGGVDKFPSLIVNVPPRALVLYPVVIACCSIDTA